MLTDSQIDTYLNAPSSCPYCKSQAIFTDETEDTMSAKRYEVWRGCKSCGKFWEDQYELNNIKEATNEVN